MRTDSRFSLPVFDYYSTHTGDGEVNGNRVDNYFFADTHAMQVSHATAGQGYIEFLTNGFQVTGLLNPTHASGGDYIYIAFAQQSLKHSNAR